MNYILGMVIFSIFMTSCAALVLLSLTYSKHTKYAIIAIGGMAMIAHGSRMITQTLLAPGSYYQPGFFDLVFDWLTLVMMGIFIAHFGFSEYFKSWKKRFKLKNKN